jgi:hypothetical protein
MKAPLTILALLLAAGPLLAGESAARRVDSALGVSKGAARASDEEFLRRLYLDLTGRPPTVGEATAFLDAKEKDKRARLIDRLLDSEEYADLTARRWTEVFFGDPRRIRLRGGGKNLAPLAVRTAYEKFRVWLTKRIADETPWPEVVKDLISAEGRLTENPPVLYKASFFGRGQPHLATADGLSRHLLGIRISCARCHDHPFDRWTQEDYYGLAAFAARTTTGAGPTMMMGNTANDLVLTEADKGDLIMPETKKMMSPRFLTGGRTPTEAGRMKALAHVFSGTKAGKDQVVRNVVNREWAYLLGRGFVNPVDDFNRRNKPAPAAAFDALISEFSKNGYSLKFLARTILLTDAYQRSSRGGGRKPFDVQTIRQLTAEQLFKSLVTSGFAPERVPDFTAAPIPKIYGDFLREVGPLHGAGSTWTEVTPLPGNPRQSLLVRNGKLAHGIVTHAMGIVSRIHRVKSDPDRIETAFLAILSRRPTYEELVRFTMYIERRKVNTGAWEDVIWTLMNSAEFLTRH